MQITRRRLVAATVLLVLGSASPPLGAKMRAEEVQAGYRGVLATLSSEGDEPALEALHSLETRALDRFPSTNQLERFWRLKLRVIRDLLEQGALDQLVPIITLHHDAYGMYRERQLPVLAAHSRTMAAELADILAQRTQDGQVRAFSGWILASFGGYMLETRSISSSADFFRRALEIAPGNRAALLGMGAAFESVGRYEAAIPPLEKAVALDSAFAEARLRLGLCLIRERRAEAGVPHLEHLVTQGAEDWIRAIAFQELARLEIEAERLERAESLLRRGLEELADGRQVALQLAALLETRGRPREARRVLEAIRDEDGARPSPRLIYAEWPTAELEQGRMAVHEMSRRNLELLAEGLRRGASLGAGP